MASVWSAACKKLAKLAHKTIKSVKIQDDLDFWTADPTHATQTDLYQSKEPEQTQDEPTVPARAQENPVVQQYAYIDGTDILWDFINNEPVDYVVHDILPN